MNLRFITTTVQLLITRPIKYDMSTFVVKMTNEVQYSVFELAKDTPYLSLGVEVQGVIGEYFRRKKEMTALSCSSQLRFSHTWVTDGYYLQQRDG